MFVNWAQWVIPLLVLAVWIITNLLRAGNEYQKQQRRQQAQGNTPGRRPTGDIDRFLEEIQRRRRDGGKKAPVEAPSVPVVQHPPRPVKPPPLPRRAERQVRVPPLPRTRTPASQVVAPPIEVVVLEEVKPAEATMGIAEANVAPSERAAYRAPTVSAVKTPTPIAKALIDLLRTREGLQSAMLLQEVIGRPMCKRPRKV
jgi:hypothetical protein